MPLIVEDGTGLANAESYVSEAVATTYFADRAIETWLDVENKEAALRRAAQYIDAVYGMRWIGSPLTTTQALDWPRVYYVYDYDVPVAQPFATVPLELKHAQCECALRFGLGTNMMPDRARATKSEQVGSIAVTYMDGASEGTTFPFIDALLSKLLSGGVSGGIVSRS